MRVRALPVRVAVAATLLLASLGAVAALTFSEAGAHAQTGPTCPAGTTFDTTTGTCNSPAVGTCPAGFTVAGTDCTRPACPAGSFAVDATVGFPEPGCFDPLTVTFTGVSNPAFFCPAGTNFVFPDPLLGANRGTCVTPAVFSCPAGTLVGQQCQQAATFGTAPVAPGGGGFADARGGNGGDVSGGEGGRGGGGFGATCNQSINDTFWEDEPTTNCGEGGRGGEGGDAGISEGGSGGLAFTIAFA